MDRRNDSRPVSDWIKEKLAALREQLEVAEEWPSTADHLLQHITEPGQTITTGDEDMLSLVVDDALKGVDITSQYPAFYQKLLADAELRQAFLDALDLLERSAAGQLSDPPPLPPPDLSFLNKPASPQPVVERTASQGWRATWRLLQAELAQLFRPSDLVYRSGYSNLDDEGIILLRSQVTAANNQLDMFLEAVRPAAEPDQLHLYLSVTSLTERKLPPLRASLQWGGRGRERGREQTAVIDQYGRARFQPIPLTTLLDETTQTFLSDLQLTLEPA
jgi:hypothetical protein